MQNMHSGGREDQNIRTACLELSSPVEVELEDVVEVTRFKETKKKFKYRWKNKMLNQTQIMNYCVLQ